MAAQTSRTALVTGAGRGIGEAVARALHGQGIRVGVLDIDRESAQRVSEDLDHNEESAIPLQADVRSDTDIAAAVDEITAHWAAPDILVNNAARTISRSVWQIGVEEWDDVLATNLRSVLLATQQCAPTMRERGWGRIVNLASLAGQQGGLVAGAHYAASKAGIVVLTKIFARDLAADGVTVNAVAPAAVRTPVMDDMAPEKIEQARAGIPVGRLGEADEVGAMVGYLCSDQAAFVTGATLDINGGVFMR